MENLNGKIIEIKDINETVKLFKIKIDKTVSFKPGQFFSITFKFNNEKITRSYSAANEEFENVDFIELLIRLNPNGKLTPKLFHGEDCELKLMGPLGIMVLPENIKETAKVNLIATGTGLGPFIPMINKLSNKNIYTKLYLGCRKEDDILLNKKLKSIENSSNLFEFTPILSQPSKEWKGKKGYVQDTVSYNKDEYYIICGNPFMRDSLLKKLKETGISLDKIIYEKWN